MIGVGVIGYGYWGPNLARNFFEVDGAALRCVCDTSATRLAVAAARYPAVRTTTSAADLIAADDIDLVTVATPPSTHYELTMAALDAGKHVLVEKPLSTSVAQAQDMVQRAASLGLLLMVDHTFVYTGAVRKMRELIASGTLGDLYYFDSVRVNLGLFQHDVDVLWDLAAHDLSIMHYALRQVPVAVSATGMAHVPGRPADVAFLTLYFDGSLIGHVHVNWLAPVKIRRTLVGGSRKMIVYDDIEPSEKIKVYDRGIVLNEVEPEGLRDILISYRTGDMVAPQLQSAEGLRTEAEHVLRCIRGEEQPLVGGQAGLDVVRVLAAASESLALRGAPVELKETR